MLFDHKKYQLNSLRLGLITNSRLYNKITVFFNCASQCSDIGKIKEYNHFYDTGLYNFVLLPLNINDCEPGDNYDIYQHYENMLKVRFPVCEKIDMDHQFFKDFSEPTENFTNYLFDKKLKFVKKTNDLKEIAYV